MKQATRGAMAADGPGAELAALRQEVHQGLRARTSFTSLLSDCLMKTRFRTMVK